MSFLTGLYTLIIGPLELFFEVVYALAYRVVGNPGISIVFLSLAMNFLVLPLYMRADKMQAEQNEIENRLQPWVKHIKRTFKGDERFMMLQTYYRQNNYRPTDALKGSVSLLLEIPFFIAAYRFLSGLQLMKGVSFGPIADLGSPDGLICIAGITINALPVLMTLINIISSAIYCKGAPIKQKAQLYTIAVIFLVFLYNSPAGLVFYWTLNNLFSLLKNIVYEIAKSKGWKKEEKSEKAIECAEATNTRMFFLSATFLALCVGLLIPSMVIKVSPAEFVDRATATNPTVYIIYALLLSTGTFVLWGGVLFMLANNTGKKILSIIMWVGCAAAIVNFMFFGNNLGNLSAQLVYDNDPVASPSFKLLNLGVTAVVIVAMYLLWRYANKLSKIICIASIVAIVVMGTINITGMQKDINNAKKTLNTAASSSSSITLSRSGKNVVVIMLDRAISSYVPYILNEKEGLKEQYSGFTYYPNTLSFGPATNTGSPGLYGGYEYTPSEMNKRPNERLVDKHNEALKVMPVLFSNNNYNVTVWNPTYANYKWIPDVTIYNKYPNIKATVKAKSSGENSGGSTEILKRNMFCYSIFRITPVFCRGILYGDGKYNEVDRTFVSAKNTDNGTVQQAGNRDTTTNANSITSDNIYMQTGINTAFDDCYQVLKELQESTYIDEGNTNTFFMMSNDATHEHTLLQEPEYEPSEIVDNTEYEKEHAVRTSIDGRRMSINNADEMKAYCSNTAAIIQLGKWFDYLKEEGVYDNTKIIIVSDHGWTFNLEGAFELDKHEGVDEYHSLAYNAFLMVKDYNSTNFSTSNEFMTNADVPTIATKDNIANPVNPFTRKAITSTYKTNNKLMVTLSADWDTNTNNGNTFHEGSWYSVRNNIFNKNNWTYEGRR